MSIYKKKKKLMYLYQLVQFYINTKTNQNTINKTTQYFFQQKYNNNFKNMKTRSLSNKNQIILQENLNSLSKTAKKNLIKLEINQKNDKNDVKKCMKQRLNNKKQKNNNSPPKSKKKKYKRALSQKKTISVQSQKYSQKLQINVQKQSQQKHQKNQLQPDKQTQKNQKTQQNEEGNDKIQDQKNKQVLEQQKEQIIVQINKIDYKSFENEFKITIQQNQILTVKQCDGLRFWFKGSLSLIDSQEYYQKNVIKKLLLQKRAIQIQKYHIKLKIESNIESQIRHNFQEVVLNSFNIPQCLEDRIKNSEDFYKYLLSQRNKIQLCSSGQNIGIVTYLKVLSRKQPIIFIPLFYPKDIIIGKSKRIGFASFNQQITKKTFNQILKNQKQRKLFYDQSFQIAQKIQQNKNNGFTFEIIQFLPQLSVGTLKLSQNIHMNWEQSIKFNKVIVLDLQDVQCIEVLQNFEFSQLKQFIIGGKKMINLRSLRKLHITQSAELRIKSLQSQYDQFPSKFTIKRGLESGQEYTFSNLEYLSEVSFNFGNELFNFPKRVTYKNMNDRMVPINLFAKLNQKSICNHQFQSYMRLNSKYMQ